MSFLMIFVSCLLKKEGVGYTPSYRLSNRIIYFQGTLDKILTQYVIVLRILEQ
jgi:hypothetical protein